MGDCHGLRRLDLEAANLGLRIRAVQHLGAAIVGDDNFADEAVGLLHQDDVHFAVFRNLQADLRTADTDGGHRGVQGHGVRIGFRDLTGHESEHALQCGERNRAFLRARIINHFVQDHLAALTHGERGLISQQHAQGAVRAGFQNITLINRVADLQLDPSAVGPKRPNFAGQVFNVTDGLAISAGQEPANLLQSYRHRLAPSVAHRPCRP